MEDSAINDPELALRAIQRALRFRRITIQFLWLPASFFALVLGVGFQPLSAPNYPAWIDPLLEATMICLIVSLGLLPFAWFALSKCNRQLDKAAVAALPHCDHLSPASCGEFLGNLRVSTANPIRLTLVHKVVPDFQRISTNFGLIASAIALPTLASNPKSIIGYVIGFLFIYGLIALLLAPVNTRRVVEYSLENGDLRIRHFVTITTWHWPRFFETTDTSLPDAALDQLGAGSIALMKLNSHRLARAINQLGASD